jgi:iron complex transport system ATP-binding protein
MIKLEIQNISLSYNHSLVLSGLSLEVTPGEMLGIIGPNGCGKTTVIKALSRVMETRSGRIMLDDREINTLSRIQVARLIGVVPQSPAVPETFTVAEIVLLGRTPHLGLLRHESPRDLKIAAWAMERTGVSIFSGRRMSELSGGERQRVTIARVLAQEPQAILLDEPTANLDINHQTAIMDLIKDLCRENNLAVLIALHDLNLASQYCDRLAMLRGGRLFAEGTPQETMTAENIRAVYGMESCIYPHPENNLPMVLVKSRTYIQSHSGDNTDGK